MHGRRRNSAPYWIKARYGGKCQRCEGPVKKGDDVLYFPDSRTLLCNRSECGPQHQRDMDAEKFDEAMYSYQP
jgi:hypothetical protein